MRLATITKIGIAGLSLAAALEAGSARAAIPSPDGSIDGCLNPTTGALRAVDTQAGQGCSSFERSVRWNLAGQQGTQGPAGPEGPAGPAGPQGPPGPTGPDTLIVFQRAYQGNDGLVPGCQGPIGAATCGRLDVGPVRLQPGVWEIQAQLVSTVEQRSIFDPSRELTCTPDASLPVASTGSLRVTMDKNGVPYHSTWTWLVPSPTPAEFNWNLSCSTTWPIFSSTGARTDTFVRFVAIIARPVASVIQQQ